MSIQPLRMDELRTVEGRAREYLENCEDAVRDVCDIIRQGAVEEGLAEDFISRALVTVVVAAAAHLASQWDATAPRGRDDDDLTERMLKAFEFRRISEVNIRSVLDGWPARTSARIV